MTTALAVGFGMHLPRTRGLFAFDRATLQDREKARVRPTGAARTLLQIIERDPDAVRRALAAV